MEENRQDEITQATTVGGNDVDVTPQEQKDRAAKYLANWQRAEADFDNYRKRVEQARDDTIKYANAVLILNLLPVLDDLERALKSLPGSLGQLSWTEGIRLIQRKLQATLEAQGVSEVKAMGETFDPSLHEAVAQGAGEEGRIIDEVQKGYQLNGRLIRPARVVVGKGDETTGEQTTSRNEGG